MNATTNNNATNNGTTNNSTATRIIEKVTRNNTHGTLTRYRCENEFNTVRPFHKLTLSDYTNAGHFAPDIDGYTIDTGDNANNERNGNTKTRDNVPTLYSINRATLSERNNALYKKLLTTKTMPNGKKVTYLDKVKMLEYMRKSFKTPIANATDTALVMSLYAYKSSTHILITLRDTTTNGAYYETMLNNDIDDIVQTAVLNMYANNEQIADTRRKIDSYKIIRKCVSSAIDTYRHKERDYIKSNTNAMENYKKLVCAIRSQFCDLVPVTDVTTNAPVVNKYGATLYETKDSNALMFYENETMPEVLKDFLKYLENNVTTRENVQIYKKCFLAYINGIGAETTATMIRRDVRTVYRIFAKLRVYAKAFMIEYETA